MNGQKIIFITAIEFFLEFSVTLNERLGCETDIVCNLCGRFIATSGTCDCSSEWTGEACSALALLPAEIDSGYLLSPSSSWGGKILNGSGGNYDMYVAFIHGWRVRNR